MRILKSLLGLKTRPKYPPCLFRPEEVCISIEVSSTRLTIIPLHRNSHPELCRNVSKHIGYLFLWPSIREYQEKPNEGCSEAIAQWPLVYDVENLEDGLPKSGLTIALERLQDGPTSPAKVQKTIESAMADHLGPEKGPKFLFGMK